MNQATFGRAATRSILSAAMVATLCTVMGCASFGQQGEGDGPPPPPGEGRQGQGRGPGGPGGPGRRGPGGPGGPGRRGPQGQGQGPQGYSLEQAISDNAQLHTIAFSGLAFITGDFGASTFIPPGKVCDFFGFQYMRDIDAQGTGHNPKFLDRVAGNVLYALSDANRTTFANMARVEAGQMEKLALMRLPLIKAFWREMKGDRPAGSAGLNKAEVQRYVGDIFAFDAEMAYQRARMFGEVIGSFNTEQKAYLAKMKFGDYSTWPDVDVQPFKLERGTPKMVNVAYMTYASEMFSWMAGSVEADVYFCPERHGTYFGGFYMKDMPAMGQRDFNISTSRTGDSGLAFIEALSETQRKNVTDIPDIQRKALNEVITVRRAISTELRKFLKGGAADRAKVVALGRRYGELDGEMSWAYATAFGRVDRTLTAEQRTLMMKLRDLDGYTSAPYYIYSDAARGDTPIPSSDHFFFAPSVAAK